MRKRLIPSIVLLSPLSVCGATQILVPAYFDPGTNTDWATMTSSVSASVPITAIMNPDSGPVANASSGYTTAITNLEAAGGKVIAYVHTGDGDTTPALTTVEGEVDTYYKEYPNLEGIFVDEMGTTPSELKNYYKPLYAYIKSKHANAEVIGNPGMSTLQTYLFPTPAAADVLVTFEDSTGYSSYKPSAWQSNFSAGSFANIVYSQPDVATMQTDLSQSVINRAGNVYITDLGGSNPYASLPTYWSQEVAAVRALNIQALKSIYVATGSGDYNAMSNWSGSIPNGIDAEADFMSSIAANHTVYADSAITAGKIVFNNSYSYVLAGAGSLTLQTSTGSAIVDAQVGTQKITLPITVASNAIFNAGSGAALVISGPVTIAAGITLSESGAGQVTFLSPITVQSGGSAAFMAGASVESLVLASGSNASVLFTAPTADVATQVGSLTLAGNSLLNLHGSDLVIHDGDLSTLEGQIKTGQNLSSGIGSSSVSADSTHLTALGIIENQNAGTPIFTAFDGSAVSASDLLVKETTYGDANLDGVVNIADYARIDAGYSAGLTGWYNGDFNYDGTINGADFTLIDNGFNANPVNSAVEVAAVTTEIATDVPEPASLLILLSLAGGITLLRRRRPSL